MCQKRIEGSNPSDSANCLCTKPRRGLLPRQGKERPGSARPRGPAAGILLRATRSMTRHDTTEATFAAGTWPTALPLVARLRGVEPHAAAAHADPLLQA